MKTIRESGVDFGPYKEENLFYIEQSGLYKSLGEGLKTTEFILQVNNATPNILFVEVKTNAPNPENRGSSEEKRKKFEAFYTEVPDKFVDSLGIYTAALLKRYADDSEIGMKLRHTDLKSLKLTFVLVITNPDAQIDWLPPIKEVLTDRLRRWLRIWNIDVVVCNQDLAKRYGLIKNSAD